jgi:hypothetical protein
VYHIFDALAAVLPGSAYPQIDVIGGSNFPVASLRYDDTNDEAAYFFFRAITYGSGNISVDIYWYADTATSGTVVWECQLACITPDTDSQDIETKAFATLNYVQDTHLGTTAQRLHQCTVSISNKDSIATGDWVCLRVARDGNGTNATDSMAGDAQLVQVTVSYSDT